MNIGKIRCYDRIENASLSTQNNHVYFIKTEIASWINMTFPSNEPKLIKIDNRGAGQPKDVIFPG